jgi:CBS domain containing-hemolysin-like protein
LLSTLFLIGLNAFFVTAEFSLLRVRRTRLNNLFESNAFGSESLKKVMKNLNVHILTSQVGITLTTLGVGFIALPYFDTVFSELLGNGTVARFLTLFLVFLVVSGLHSVIGEMIPKIIAIQHVETIAMRIAPLIYYVGLLLRPLVFVYRRVAYLILKVLRINATQEVYSRVYSEDELKVLIAQSQESGEIDESEEILINRVLDFTTTRVNEIFTPRYEITAFDLGTPLDEIISVAKETGYSRFPVYDEKLDDVKGFVHLKDILIANHDDPEFSVRSVMRPVIVIHEAMRLDVLLGKMQQDKTQVAIVVDEYGSVEGLITIEDILEAIVGPIDDEFDIGSVELVQKVDRNNFIVDGRVTIDVFNQAFQCQLEAEDSLTIAGFLLERLENLPEEGSHLEFSGKKADFVFIVEKMDGNRVERAKVAIKRK